MVCRPQTSLTSTLAAVSAVVLGIVLPAGPAAAATPDCRPVPGSDSLLAAGKVVVLGEQHGTVESPGFVLDLACLAVEAGLPLRVGLELADSEQARFDAFLDSSGDEASRGVLLAGEVWNAEPQYGVTSRAMLGLLDGLRRLRSAGGDVEVVLFNRPAQQGGGQQRDGEMADYLAAAATASPGALLLVLTGNIHSRVVRGTPWDESYEPMALLLSRSLAAGRLVTLDVAHGGGTAWVCLSGEEGCGSRELGARGPAAADPNTERGVVFNDTPEESGHHGWYRVGAIHASPPARLADGVGSTNDPDAAPAASAAPSTQSRTPTTPTPPAGGRAG